MIRHSIRVILVAGISLMSILSCNSVSSFFVEAESFSEKGGWVVDQQFAEEMGSSYLLAHGMGDKVADAVTEVNLPSSGEWYVYARTYDWTSPWFDGEGPGQFRVKVDGNEIGDVLGTGLRQWGWQYAGSFVSDARIIRVSLCDLTGFDGRCDALWFSRERVECADIPQRTATAPSRSESFDFVVVGGGVSGICAAVSAARLGLKTALVNDRPILGGNNSSEVRVHLGGEIRLAPYPNLGNVLNEFGHKVIGNAKPAENYCDSAKDAIVAGEKNLTLFAPYRFETSSVSDGKITSVVIRETSTGEALTLKSPMWADCTGDGTLGAKSGADFSYGRESKDVYGEPSGQESSDRIVLGSSTQWYSVKTDAPVEFPVFEYGLLFTEESAQKVAAGEWTWETGMNRDMIAEAERIRDYGMLIVYSNWSWLKRNMPQYFSNRRLGWVAYVMGKRESRRLLGDYVLTENDLLACTDHDDATVTTSWSVDLHYPDPVNSQFFPGQEFKSLCTQTPVDYCTIPYRCLYSRNVDNLFMAGRDISVSHIALGCVRVMRTCAMEGEVVGMAASVCKRNSCSPRGLYEEHFPQLQELMRKGCGRTDLENSQTFNTGHVHPGSKHAPDVEKPILPEGMK